MTTIAHPGCVRKAIDRSLGDQIRDHVNASGLSMLAVARGARIDRAALSRFLSRERGLRLDALDRLTVFLHLRVVRGPKPTGDKR
jgi:transcriptional regulator with XRE-family HTH domain